MKILKIEVNEKWGLIISTKSVMIHRLCFFANKTCQNGVDKKTCQCYSEDVTRKLGNSNWRFFYE